MEMHRYFIGFVAKYRRSGRSGVNNGVNLFCNDTKERGNV